MIGEPFHDRDNLPLSALADEEAKAFMGLDEEDDPWIRPGTPGWSQQPDDSPAVDDEPEDAR